MAVPMVASKDAWMAAGTTQKMADWISVDWVGWMFNSIANCWAEMMVLAKVG